jgi:PRTRC genetic system protein E
MTAHLDHTYHLDPLGRSTMQTTIDHDEELERGAGREPAEDEQHDEHTPGKGLESTDEEPPDDADALGAEEADDSEADDADDTTEPASLATTTPDESIDVTPLPAAPDAVTGIIGGLATTIPAKGTMLLAIAKADDGQVLVTILPAKGEKETESAIPLVVRGTPDGIDRELVGALQHYVPARHIALRAASQIARDTAAAAKKSADAAKSRATSASSTVKKKTPSLTIHLVPKDAVLRVVDATDRVQNLKAGVKAELAKGRYIVTVTKVGFKTKIQNAVVKDGPEVMTITLEQSDQMSLLGGNGK